MNPEPRDDDKDPREAKSRATVDPPTKPPPAPSGAKKAPPRAKSKREGEPSGARRDAPAPQGDAPMTSVEKPAKPAKPRGRSAGKTAPPAALLPNASDLGRLLAGEHSQPHDILGAHPLTVGDVDGVVVRALMPNAIAAEAALEDGRVISLDATASGLANLYSGFVPGASLPLRYRLRFHFADSAVWERDDPYRFLPTI